MGQTHHVCWTRRGLFIGCLDISPHGHVRLDLMLIIYPTAIVNFPKNWRIANLVLHWKLVLRFAIMIPICICHVLRTVHSDMIPSLYSIFSRNLLFLFYIFFWSNSLTKIRTTFWSCDRSTLCIPKQNAIASVPIVGLTSTFYSTCFYSSIIALSRYTFVIRIYQISGMSFDSSPIDCVMFYSQNILILINNISSLSQIFFC